MKSKRRKPTNHAQSMQDSILKIPFLPIELITEILLRLPVKSLLQFTCVSKSWLALISSPEFVKNHLSSSSNNKDYTHHKLMLCPYSYKDSLKYCSISSFDSVTEVFDLDFPLNKNSESVSIVGSVNGLICLTIKERDYFLWNPSIRKCKKLPYSGSSSRSRYFSMYGFGYDELHDDYKVVDIRAKNNGWNHVQIYSLNSHCWRSTDDFQSGGVSFYKSGMFVNGRLHWVTSVHGVRVGNGLDIIYVNLADGKYGKLELPYCGEGNFELKLGALGSDLSVFCSYERTQIDVWVMKEYGVNESWIKMFTINTPDNPARSGCLHCPLFCMSNKGQILLEVGSTFMIYNLKDDSIRYREVTNCADLWDANIYIESLVRPFTKRNQGCNKKEG